MLRLLEFENAILDLFEKNRITIQDAKTVLWTLLTAIYEDELIEEPQRRENIIENIERQKEQLLVNILGPGVHTITAEAHFVDAKQHEHIGSAEHTITVYGAGLL
jgi:hypothetical protein